MEDVTTNIEIGKLTTLTGELKFTFVLKGNDNTHVQIYCYDPSDLRKSGILLQLDHVRYWQLKKIIEKIDNTVEKLKSSDQIPQNKF